MWSLRGMRERKLVQIVEVTWPKWPPCPYLVKPFNNLFLWNLTADDLETWHAVLCTRLLPNLFKLCPRGDLDLFYGKIKFGPACFCTGKIYNNGFFETIIIYDIKVGRCSQLKWVHEALWVPKAKVIHWPWSNSISFNIFKLWFLYNHWYEHIVSIQMSDTGPTVLWLHFCKHVFIKAINKIIYCRSYSDKYGSPGRTSHFITSYVNTSNFRSKKLEVSRK